MNANTMKAALSLLILLACMTLVGKASSIGAYCLDGSLPANHWDRGLGAGARNWLLQFEAYNLLWDLLLFLLTIRMGKHIHLIVILSMIAQMTPTQSEYINITRLESAVASGTVCLDGSPPAYYYATGCEEGLDKWLVHLEGGGWCASGITCQSYMKDNMHGTTRTRPNSLMFDEILSGNETTNPDFYNWNRVKVAYCDGSSYMGDVEEVDHFDNLTFTRRGARVFDAVIHDLLDKGMKNASMAILSGESAGGLGALLRCDGFRTLLSTAERVKCISDAGFFLLGKNQFGLEYRENYFGGIVEYHGLNKSLPASCTSKMDPKLCIFPENFVKDIHTSLFLLQSAFDSFQLHDLEYANTTTWKDCNTNFSCKNEDFRTIQDFGTMFLEELKEIRNSSSIGIFVDSCYVHTLLNIGPKGWNASPVLVNKTIAKAVGDWYFDRNSVQEIDNQTIPHLC